MVKKDILKEIFDWMGWNEKDAQLVCLIQELAEKRKVKSLRWVLEENGNYCAHTILGDFLVNQIGTYWRPDGNAQHIGDVEQAKNYCNEWYINTIEKALE